MPSYVWGFSVDRPAVRGNLICRDPSVTQRHGEGSG